MSGGDHPMGPGPEDGTDLDWDDIDGDDVIGTASARLLSTCPDRLDRLASLSLLGLLLDHADEGGRVRLPLDTLARELDVEPERAVRLLQRLLVVEAVRSEGDAVVVAGGHPDTSRTFRPSRFMANLVAVLEREPGTPPTPGPVVEGTLAPLPLPRPRPRAGPRRRALVALGVGLGAMALATAPSGEPATSLRTVAAPAASSGRAPWAVDLAQGAAPAPGLADADEPPALAPEPPRLEEGAPITPQTAPPDASPRPAGRQDGSNDEDGDGDVLVLPAPAFEPEAAVPAGPPAPPPAHLEPAAPSTPPGRPPASEQRLVCPQVGPEALVSDSRLQGPGPPSLLDLAGDVLLRVTGTVFNASDAAMTIEAIEVGAGEGTDRVVGAAEAVPFVLAPGGRATWEANLLTGLDRSSEPPVDARVIAWSWTDPDLAACAS